MLSSFALISQVHHLHDRLLAAAAQQHEHVHMSAGRLRLLAAVWEANELGVQELADRTCLSKSTVSTMLPHLATEGLVELVPDEQDRRARIVRLTPFGKEMQERHTLLLAKTERELFGGVAIKDRETFHTVLLQLKKNLVDLEQGRS